MYVPSDNGGHWQSLSLNLPDLQVSDLVVETHDLVIGTHGRSIWILDDIAPVRQLSDDVARTDTLHVFTPEEAVRRARPAAVDYYLKAKAERVTIDILDASGQVIRTVVGPPDPAAVEKQDEDPFRPPVAGVGVEAGLNRFAWDLRHAGATTFPGMIMWGARPERGPLALPGAYQVRVTADGQSVTRPSRSPSIRASRRAPRTCWHSSIWRCGCAIA